MPNNCITAPYCQSMWAPIACHLKMQMTRVYRTELWKQKVQTETLCWVGIDSMLM